MMRMSGIKMTSTVNRLDLLKTVEENLAKHSLIVEEAQKGYLKKAQEELECKLAKVQSGKVISLSSNLRLPVDNRPVYKTVIEMLKWSKDETVVLGPDEFRQLVQDEWDWTGDFLFGNSQYSQTARKMSSGRDE